MPSYEEDTRIFVLVYEKSFVRFAELSTGRQWAYAFTSQKKAEDFIRTMRKGGSFKNINTIFPCTLKEWFDWQPKKNLPDLAIDLDPQRLLAYPLQLDVDLSTHDLQCITRDSANGKVYDVLIRPQHSKDNAART